MQNEVSAIRSDQSKATTGNPNLDALLNDLDDSELAAAYALIQAQSADKDLGGKIMASIESRLQAYRERLAPDETDPDGALSVQRCLAFADGIAASRQQAESKSRREVVSADGDRFADQLNHYVSEYPQFATAIQRVMDNPALIDTFVEESVVVPESEKARFVQKTPSNDIPRPADCCFYSKEDPEKWEEDLKERPYMREIVSWLRSQPLETKLAYVLMWNLGSHGTCDLTGKNIHYGGVLSREYCTQVEEWAVDGNTDPLIARLQGFATCINGIPA